MVIKFLTNGRRLFAIFSGFSGAKHPKPPHGRGHAGVIGDALKTGVKKGRKPLVLKHCRPIFVTAGDKAGAVFVPTLLDALIVVQIELTIDHSPAARVAFRGLALSHGPSAIAAILWSIFGRVTKEQVEVFFAGKAEFCALIRGRVICGAFGWLADGEVSDRVIALQRKV